jgi:hypothetical protein
VAKCQCCAFKVLKVHLLQSTQVNYSGGSLLGQSAAKNCLQKRWCMCGRTDAWPGELPEFVELNSKRQAFSGRADEGRAALGPQPEISEDLLLGRGAHSSGLLGSLSRAPGPSAAQEGPGQSDLLIPSQFQDLRQLPMTEVVGL